MRAPKWNALSTASASSMEHGSFLSRRCAMPWLCFLSFQTQSLSGLGDRGTIGRNTKEPSLVNPDVRLQLRCGQNTRVLATAMSSPPPAPMKAVTPIPGLVPIRVPLSDLHDLQVMTPCSRGSNGCLRGRPAVIEVVIRCPLLGTHWRDTIRPFHMRLF